MKRLLAVFAKRRIARDLDDELLAHQDLLTEDFIRQGMTPEGARLAARRSMGNLAGMKEEYRDARGLPWLETTLQNIRYAARVLRKSPGFTAVAIFALALGIGANSAIFSMTDVLLLRPLQIANVDRIVNVVGTAPGMRRPAQTMSPGDFADFRDQSHSVEHLAAWYQDNANLTAASDPQRVLAARVSTSFFDALPARPLLGHLFRAEPDYTGLPHVAVLSYRLWQAGFGADAGVAGKTVRLNGEPYEIAGVMGKEFLYPPGAEIWIPMALEPQDRASHDAMFLAAVGRLRPGVSVGQASAELDTIARGIARRHPRNHEQRGARAELMTDAVSGDMVRPVMSMLMAAAGFVLLLAVVNVANLQLARVSLRAREIALRFAVGASRWRIVSQFLTESVALSLVSAAASVLFALWATRALRPMMPAEMWKFIPGWERLGVNGDVLIFALAAGSAAGILSGIAPALFASRTHLEDALKDGGRGSSGGARRHRVRNVFVTAQIVPAMVLLVGAVMMVKGLRLVTEPAPNLDPAHALTMRITLPPAQYPDAARQRIFAQRVLDGVTAVAGVETPALIRNLPYSNRHASSSILVAGRESDRESVDAAYQWISSRYFEAMRLPILTGRAFGSGDDENGAPTAIVSESFARREFPNGDAIGRQLREGPAQSATPWMTIVGVAGNLRTDPFQFGFEETVYRPFRQVPVDSFSVLLRIPVPGSLAAPAAAAIHAVDAELPVYDVMSLEKVFSLQVSPVRLIASLLGSFGVLALILSSVGVYSIMAHSVSERKREIGVRVAMGAERSQVVWMFVRQSLWLAGIGMVIGAPAAYGFARLLQAVFYGVIAADGMVFTMAACAIVSAAVLASYSAARRAAGIDPVATLREE